MNTITRKRADSLTSAQVGREVYVIGTTPGILSDVSVGRWMTTLYISGRVLRIRNDAAVII
jgi:hypothetical protein